MRSFRLLVETEEGIGVLRRRRMAISLAKGFKIRIEQAGASSPLVVDGFVSSDGSTVSTSVGYEGSTHLKRRTDRK